MTHSDRLWADLVLRFAMQSHCRSRKVGAILVKDGRQVAQAWNGAPKGCSESACIRCNMKDKGQEIKSGTSLEMSICSHAESNLIANAGDLGISTHDATMYCTNKPCGECAKLISRSGIKEVGYLNFYHSEYTDIIFKKNGIKCFKLKDERTDYGKQSSRDWWSWVHRLPLM